MYRIKLTETAYQHYRHIQLFSMTKWGKQITNRYMTSLDKLIIHLIHHPNLGKKYNAIILMIPMKKHIIYYRLIADRIVLIAVLHSKSLPQFVLKRFMNN